MNIRKLLHASAILGGVALLSACGGDSSSSANEDDSSSSIADSATISSSSESSTFQSWSWDLPKETWMNNSVDFGTLTDSRDGKTYKTVKIGTQTWMAENLDYETENSYCYDGEDANCEVAGRLYTWAAAIDSTGLLKNNLLAVGDTCGYGRTCTLPEKIQGACPKGWHLPTSDEWDILYKYVKEDQGLSSNTVGTYLKTTAGWKSETGISAGTDTYGFSAFPAGSRDYDGGYFDYAGSEAYFWSATEYDSSYAYGRDLFYDTKYLEHSWSNKGYGSSVRCVKD